MAYTIKELCENGPQFAMAMLIRTIKNREPFVTYGAISKEIEYQLKISKIFSTHIGYVAGTLMNKILEIEPNAPLINVLITRSNGIPGKGVGSYLAERYNDNKLNHWDYISWKSKLKIVQREREKIFDFDRWENINRRLFSDNARGLIRERLARDYDSCQGNYGGEAESEEHRALKAWVSKDPRHIGLSRNFGQGEIEARLQSGDEVDVVFSHGNSFRMVEVKSQRSNDEDFRRGIYQCVKYREIKKAEYAPYTIDVQAVLVTERELSADLKERAKLLGIILKNVAVARAT